jgi:hypothetical protein
VDPSALIFVALAVAWAVYLIPKALEHHEESARTRTVERFSATLRVLARREPVSRRKARLVASTTSTTTTTATVTTERTSSRRTPAPQLTAAQLRARRHTAARAARRRLRVVTLILLANAAVAAAAWFKLVDWVWCAAPVGVLAAWLVACRLMVKRERAVLRPRDRIPAEVPTDRPRDATDEIARVDAAPAGDEAASHDRPRDPDSWDPVSVPLPTYVSKPVARRTVSTIDLDSTGVWSSGRSAADSKLAREAEAVERPQESGDRRASGA